MKSVSIVCLVAAAMLGVACGCSTKSSNPPEPTASRTLSRTETGPLAQREVQMIEAQATVEKIDRATREVTLRASDGRKFTVTASPAVKRLDEVKPGDRVVTQFYESLAFEVREPTASERLNPRTTGAAAGRTDEHLPPGAGVANVSKTIVSVQSIDLANNTVSLRTPEGETVTVRARYPENLKRVSVGDTIAVTYAEALAEAIDPA